VNSDSLNSAVCFTPLYQHRVWGGRALESALGRHLPAGPVGESWEMVDRPDAQSRVADGDLAGMDLHSLWGAHGSEIFGLRRASSPRFPLLLKLLDARESLSVQVHPSGEGASGGLGEPKTEWWYVLDASPGAAVYAGFRQGSTQARVERALETGELECLLHKIPVQTGDSFFVPAGRIHAIGGGCLIAEVQQNSDTTFRVFDWNRIGSDGMRRELHLKESMACINFEDYSPELLTDLRETVFSCDFFSISGVSLQSAATAGSIAGAMLLLARGGLRVGNKIFRRGDWFVLPRQAESQVLEPSAEGAFLVRVTIPE
jgi:mannose-6-phosphate isomerase